jgi:hypothetical protein
MERLLPLLLGEEPWNAMSDWALCHVTQVPLLNGRLTSPEGFQFFKVLPTTSLLKHYLQKQAYLCSNTWDWPNPGLVGLISKYFLKSHAATVEFGGWKEV